MPADFSIRFFSKSSHQEKTEEIVWGNQELQSFETMNEIVSIPAPFKVATINLLRKTHSDSNTTQSSVIKTGKHRAVYKLETKSDSAFLKHYKSPCWKSALRNQILGSQAEREYRAIQLAQNVGLNTPKVIGLGKFSFGDSPEESLLLTQEVSNSKSLSELLNSKHLLSVQQKKSLILAVSQLVARMIDVRVSHRDFHAGNVLINLENPQAPVVTLIDLQSFQLNKKLSHSAKRLLGTLFHSVALTTSKSERLRFLKSLAIRIGIESDAVKNWCVYISESLMNLRHSLLKKQDRRWRRGNRRLRIQKEPKFESRSVTELEKSFSDTVARNPEALFKEQNVQRWFKQSKSGKVASLKISVNEASPLFAYFKQVEPKRGLRGGLSWFKTSPVQKAWEIGHAFLRRDIPTPKPLLFRSPNKTWNQSSYFLSETVPDSIVLSAFYEAYLLEMSDTCSNSWINRYAKNSANIIRRMHDAGYDHRDMKSNNILVSEKHKETKMWILDLDSVKQWKKIPSSRRQQNIARFCRSSFDCSLVQSTHRLRFLKNYLGNDFSKQWKNYWRAIEKRMNSKKQKTARKFSIAKLFCLASVALLMMLPGCSMNKNVAVGLPNQHSINSDQLVILSDFQLPKDHKLVRDLAKLRKDVSSTLSLDLKERDVVVYLFSEKAKYQKYLDSTYPGLPVRRAYFVGTPKELSVYAVWGDRIEEDLRHEYTHGLLHAGLKTVPLWLDEGLAEYFEVAGDEPGGLNASSIKRLTQAYKNGWKPDMNRLELLETVGEMQRMDYQESWAWIHFMLNENENTKQVLLSYLQDLNTGRTPTPLSDRLRLVMPDNDSRFVSYLSKLQSDVRTVGFAKLRSHFR